jgi:2-dehydropantoate 2-reductase
MKVCIVGAGAVGATIGAKLAAIGHDVVLIARGAHLASIRAQGLRLVDHVDRYSGTYGPDKGLGLRLRAAEDPADCGGPQDCLLIALKAYAIAAMLPRLRPLLAPHTVVVPAINGLPWWYFHRHGGPDDGLALRSLDPEGRMFEALDCTHIVGCVVHLAAEVRAPGQVHHTAGRRLILGEPDGTDSPRLRSVCGALEAAGFEAQRSSRIRQDVWAKLIGNLSFNPIAALTGYLMNQICADHDVVEVIRAILREGMAVADRYGIEIAMTPDQRIDVARQLGAARISMLQDLEQRRPLELAAVVGAVIELADRAGVPVPATRIVHALALGRARALGLAT